LYSIKTITPVESSRKPHMPVYVCVLECEEPRPAEWEPTTEEKAMLREEFLSQMHQRFLDGKDDFNYRLNQRTYSFSSFSIN